MSKMTQRRKRRKASKLLKSMPKIKVRRKGLPPNKRHKTGKDYDRKLDRLNLKKDLASI